MSILASIDEVHFSKNGLVNESEEIHLLVRLL